MGLIPKQFVAEVRLKRETVPSFEEYPFCLDAVRHLEEIELDPCLTVFVGENGSGKSTLLEAIAVKWGFNPEGGSKNFQFETHRSHSVLHEHIVLAKGMKKPRTGYFLRAESFFNVATEIEELDQEASSERPIIDSYGGVSLHEQSHGESFLSLVTNRFSANGFYILDEPEAALSPSRLLSLMVRLKDLMTKGSQFIIATHSPMLMAFPGAKIFALGSEGVERVEFRETDHWRLTERFMRDPEGMLERLFEA